MTNKTPQQPLQNSDVRRIKRAVRGGNFFDQPKWAAALEHALGAGALDSLTELHCRELRIALLDEMELVDDAKKRAGFERTLARVTAAAKAKA
jgi:hypothetical protein